jgi:hypothetical protein
MLSFHDAISKFRDRTDTPRAYLERCIERIDALEPAVMAFAFLNVERARKTADESGERYKTGRPLSVVDGMPVGIKDLIETHDMPTEYGSELFRGHQPMTDAASVRALRQGGAVLVGKTVTVCFGGGDPARTRNPFDTRRTPGGSSSGTAAAVASRMLPAALGKFLRCLCAQADLRGDQSPRLVLDGLQHGPRRHICRHAVRHVDHGQVHCERGRRRSVASGPLWGACAAGATQAYATHPARYCRVAHGRARGQGGV